MVVKVYISGISGNKEVKKRQQRVLMILESKNIKYDVIDITEPGREADKDFMQSNAKFNGGTVSDPNPRSPLPPQVFNDDEYCGDYDQFDMANEVDTLEQFLKVEVPPEESPLEDNKESTVNGDVAVEKEVNENKSKENSIERDAGDNKIDKKEESASKEGTPARDETPAREATPAKERSASKESSVTKDEQSEKEGSQEKEVEKEEIVERQSLVEKEGTPSDKAASPEKELESKKSSKENTPETDESVNENGTVSSREQSEEKQASEAEIERKKDNPSEALIESEQAAAE